MNHEREMISNCKKFDPRAQKRLYDRYSPVLRGVCSRYCRDAEEVKDILQEGFLKIFTKIDQYSGEGNFEGWMKTIVINTALEFYRKNTRQHIVHVEDMAIFEDSLTEDLSFMESMEVEVIMKGIQALQEEYRVVFNMFFLDDYSHKEIATLLCIDESASRKRLQRAKMMLKEKFNVGMGTLNKAV